VTWVEEYFILTHGETRAKQIWDHIDKRYKNLFYFNDFSDFPLVLVLHLHFRGYNDLKKAVGLSSGQAMIQRH
jgi:hypothetical protein